MGKLGRTRSSMEGVLLDLGPARGTLLLPDDDLAVIGTRREDLTKLGVRPGDLPNWASMAKKGKFWADLNGCVMYGLTP